MNISKQCIVILVTLVCIAGCCNQPPSLLRDPNPYDAPLPPFSTPVTREEVRQAFLTYSAPAIVAKLSENNEANWRMIMKKIAEGDKEWLLCAAAYIRPGTDAGYTEEFTDALAYALASNPEAVLFLEDWIGIPLARVCSWPFVEPEYDFVLNYGEKAIAALKAIDNPDYRESRDFCLRRLRRGFDFLKKEYREGRWGY